LRLLILTGARLREILDLRWDHVDLQRGLLFLPDSKTGKKTIVLGLAALAVLENLPRVGKYVVAGTDNDKPRADLQRPWALEGLHYLATNSPATSVIAWRLHRLAIAARLVYLREIDRTAF
jgi:integrase